MIYITTKFCMLTSLGEGGNFYRIHHATGPRAGPQRPKNLDIYRLNSSDQIWSGNRTKGATGFRVVHAP